MSVADLSTLAVDAFPPSMAAARARLAAVRPADYARTRNALAGAVTRLSPYLTHGFLTLPETVEHLLQRYGLHPQHKLLAELGWRAYFHHVWRHTGDGIFQSLHAGPMPDEAYAPHLPADIREARTGLAVIDDTVRTLYETGYIHNHARMWLASYVVHLRHVHWRAGADWLYAHLLDGDLASNHLSWQWIAGTGSHKPYLFDSANVARHAPALEPPAGSVLHRSREALEGVARDPAQRLPETAGGPGLAEPACGSQPPASAGFGAPHAEAVAGRDVWLVHPWSLGEVPADRLAVAVLAREGHAAWPWSERRWRFVATRMAELSPLRWMAGAADLVQALGAAASVAGWDDPHLPPALRRIGLQARPSAFAEPAVPCHSFSSWWRRVGEGPLAARAQGRLFA